MMGHKQEIIIPKPYSQTQEGIILQLSIAALHTGFTQIDMTCFK
jgi:hypothetical protein